MKLNNDQMATLRVAFQHGPERCMVRLRASDKKCTLMVRKGQAKAVPLRELGGMAARAVLNMCTEIRKDRMAVYYKFKQEALNAYQEEMDRVRKTKQGEGGSTGTGTQPGQTSSDDDRGAETK